MPIPRFLYERNKKEMMEALEKDRAMELGKVGKYLPDERFLSRDLDYELSLKFQGLIIEDDERIRDLYDSFIHQKKME